METDINRYIRHNDLGASIDCDTANILSVAAEDSFPVSGFTHNHYRYPARFSPRFVRTAIELFTRPGDLVLDPFMGGGTVLVEALASGRIAIGTDISSLAEFVSQVKTTLLSDHDVTTLRAWAKRAARSIHMHLPSFGAVWWEERGYLRHLGNKETWRLRKAIEQSLFSASSLRPMHLEQFARCIILRTSQWALDGRKKIPTIKEYRDQMIEFSDMMINGSQELRNSMVGAIANGKPPSVACLNRSAIGLDEDARIANHRQPKLVLTSPPYPGIHVLYHRWQVNGRKETPAPFWIANKLDGAGAKFYTMGDRKEIELHSYYENVGAAFGSVRKICDRSTVIVQLVAFTNPSWQLPKYLSVMSDAGLEEITLPSIHGSSDGRIWRKVPNRRWHAHQMGDTPGSCEVVLIHKPRMPY